MTTKTAFNSSLQMTAKYDNLQSWEKETFWKLSNGWVAREAWNVCYGPFIRALYSPDGKTWDASNGEKADYYNEVFKTDEYINLPSFAAHWRDDKNLIRLPSSVTRQY